MSEKESLDHVITAMRLMNEAIKSLTGAGLLVTSLLDEFGTRLETLEADYERREFARKEREGRGPPMVKL
jgi:hypothetical protein